MPDSAHAWSTKYKTIDRRQKRSSRACKPVDVAVAVAVPFGGADMYSTYECVRAV
jgi:hypothetical protein